MSSDVVFVQGGLQSSRKGLKGNYEMSDIEHHLA